jgi:NAD(P)-dependent dehydrogenase (short-subunit alcohol dehydrogenase family)
MSGKTCLITGASGLLGRRHAEALLEYGATVVLTDIDENRLLDLKFELDKKFETKKSFVEVMDVTSTASIDHVFDKFESIDVLVNNAAKDPKVKRTDSDLTPSTRFETMTEEFWKGGLDVIVNGTFLCSQAFCNRILSRKGRGVIINMASDLGVIAPDQRLYKNEGTPEHLQNVKPITYSAAKWAVLGMTKYLAVYFADKNIRVNSLSPAGVFNDHPEDFVSKLSNVIPMARMANVDEFKGAIVFLASEASSYMTGANLIIDGGRTSW